MKKIAVVGMGQGGMVAAIKLAEAGYAVDIYEKGRKGEVSYPWKDDIRSDIFSIVGLPMPSAEIYCQKNKWLFVSPSEKYSLPMPPCKPMEEISIDRKGLSGYFGELAANAGCNLYYDAEIACLSIEEERVVGIKVGKTEKKYDLVIDASGMNSILRAQVPKKFGIAEKPEETGVLHGYRAFFKRNEGANPIEEGIDSTMVVKHLGRSGISWCNLNDENNVDILIAKIGGLTEEETEESLAALKRQNPILSSEKLYERKVEICLRCALPCGVADGYVAIGDSAFMTMPLMGSGIESSMKAGNMLARYIIENGTEDFTAESMWGFWVEYMKKIGKDFAFIDVLKRWALSDNLPAATVDWIFGSGLVEREDLALVTTEDGAKAKIPLKSILKKIGILLKKFGLVCRIIGVLLKADKAKRISDAVPKKYNAKKINKWAKKYEKAVIAYK